MEKEEIWGINISRPIYTLRVVDIDFLIHNTVYEGIHRVILFRSEFEAGGEGYKSLEYLNS